MNDKKQITIKKILQTLKINPSLHKKIIKIRRIKKNGNKFRA